MKNMSTIALKTIAFNKDPIICDHVMAPEGMMPVDPPILATEHKCQWCGTETHYCPFVDPNKSRSRLWLCSNVNCLTYKLTKSYNPSLESKKLHRAILWPLFCEFNGIGNLHHDVTFENVKQSEGKISFMLKFIAQPQGLILMQGNSGTGKTYAALGMCEMFTRKDSACIFTTQTKIEEKWQDKLTMSQLLNCKLLVIDDFGVAEMSKEFLKYFMDLMNTRLQWSDKGTVITTNLSKQKLVDYCGEALADRINTGQLFQFFGESRRKVMAL